MVHISEKHLCLDKLPKETDTLQTRYKVVLAVLIGFWASRRDLIKPVCLQQSVIYQRLPKRSQITVARTFNKKCDFVWARESSWLIAETLLMEMGSTRSSSCRSQRSKSRLLQMFEHVFIGFRHFSHLLLSFLKTPHRSQRKTQTSIGLTVLNKKKTSVHS